jgi:very-short-patch-repair endonuclease
MRADDLLRELAADQQGLAAVRQAYALGLTVSQVRHRLARGDWRRLTTRVIALVGAPATDLAPPMRAVLHHGPETVHVVSRRARRRNAGPTGVVHSTTDLFATHITELQGVPIVTPIRALFDIAGIEHPRRVERALDNAWARRLVSYGLLHRTLDELAERGRPGIQLVRELAGALPVSYRPPESNTERRFADILERAGERRLRRQIDEGDQANWIGRIDFVDDRLPLSVEIQSELFHGSVLDRRRDAERIAALRAAGQVVLEVWESDVWRSPAKVIVAVREARLRADVSQVA